jgi:hypothetical protein
MNQLTILDSTLREGEEFTGAFFSHEQRLAISLPDKPSRPNPWTRS